MKRQMYHEALKEYAEEQRVYLDESGICHKLQRNHGYAPKGEKIHGLTYGKRKGRTNVIGAWSSKNKLFATQTYDHNINKKTFLEWLKNHLLPTLKAGMVVIMDNAPWHKGDDIKRLIEATGATLLKLPPYSPDLNSIEHAWANLKAAIKTASKIITDIHQNIQTQIQHMGISKCD